MTEDGRTRVLLERWYDGDEAALAALIDRNIDWIRGRVQKRLGPLLQKKGSATDYVQDAMVELLRYGPRFVMSDEAQFRALVCKIIENVMRGRHDWFTAERRNVEKERPMGSGTAVDLDAKGKTVTRPSVAFQRRESTELVRLGIGLLEDEDRDVLLRRQWDGASFAEIAEELGVSEDAARMRFNRALPKLAEKVELLMKGDFDTLLGGGP